MKPEMKQQDEQDFANAFNEDQDIEAAQTEDEAFGLGEEPANDAGDGAEPAVSVVVEDEPTAEEAPVDGEAPVEPVDAVPGEEAAPVDAEAPMPEESAPVLDVAKETQRLKSWEGRLKAREAELKSMADKSSPMEDETMDEESAESPEEEAGEDEGAETNTAMTAEDAMAQLAADFGDEFVSMISAIATKAAETVAGNLAESRMGELSATIDEIIDDLVDGKQKAHFKAISTAHPDFNELAQSPDFAEWLRAMPDMDREEAVRVADSGSAEEIIGLLDSFKQASAPAPEAEGAGQLDDGLTDPEMAAAPAQDPADEEWVDAAEGVRSSGMRLPSQPGSAEDFASAWEEFR